jgi:glucose/arabinose dehydrogenase
VSLDLSFSEYFTQLVNYSADQRTRRSAESGNIFVRKFLIYIIGIVLLGVFVSGCGLIGTESEVPATFDAVEPTNPTATAEKVSTSTATPAPVDDSATPTAAPTDAVEPAPDPTEAPPQNNSPVTFPDATGYEWQLLTGDLNSPVGLAHAGDGSGRLFVIEQAGVIRVVQERVLLEQPFLDIRERVGSSANEQGLLGLAFHPRYAENGYFYVNYTNLNGDTVIARFSVAGDANTADPASEVILLQIPQPYSNHNGGSINFGPDGYLYIGTGDGGSGGDPLGNGQSLDTLLGKILRIDVDNGDPYSIPDGNLKAEIWAYGLRNPWRFSFDRLTGDLYIGDVGQNAWEEIDFLPAGNPGGANFGWNYREGTHPFAGSPPEGLELIDPVAEYDRSAGISVSGGVVYRGAALPEFYGVYLYGDFGTGRVWGLLQNPDGSWQNQLLFESGANITTFGEDETGEVYLADRQGFIYKLVAKE